MRRVIKYQFKCLHCFWKDKEDIEWTGDSVEEECPICGKKVVSKKIISLEVSEVKND